MPDARNRERKISFDLELLTAQLRRQSRTHTAHSEGNLRKTEMASPQPYTHRALPSGLKSRTDPVFPPAEGQPAS